MASNGSGNDDDWIPPKFYKPYIKEAALHRAKVVKELLKHDGLNEGTSVDYYRFRAIQAIRDILDPPYSLLSTDR